MWHVMRIAALAYAQLGMGIGYRKRGRIYGSRKFTMITCFDFADVAERE